MRFDPKTNGDFIRLIIFIIFTTLCTGALVATIGNITIADFSNYKAIVTDATGVSTGDDVRIAGVKVGSVKGIKIVNTNQAEISFDVQSAYPIDQGTNVKIRYRNLVGQRYLALTDEIGHGGLLPSGSTIPVSQTRPALDLSVLFNGFKPLFAGLAPKEINKLSYEIVQVFQGEGGTLNDLLAHTASLTQTVASRDKTISSLIDSLTTVLTNVGNRDKQLNELITTFRTFVGGLKDDRAAILGSIDNISAMSVQTAGLLTGISSPFANDISSLRTFSANLVKDRQSLDTELQMIPIKLNKIGGTATYKAWFNFYLCHFGGHVTLPGNIKVPVDYSTNAPRCSLG